MDESTDGKRPDPVMLPTRINRPNGDLEYSICLRVWDVFLLLAIIGKPRRDVGVLADFAKTMSQYAIQLMPRSIIPSCMVPMTRLDPIEKKQVFHVHALLLILCIQLTRMR